MKSTSSVVELTSHSDQYCAKRTPQTPSEEHPLLKKKSISIKVFDKIRQKLNYLATFTVIWFGENRTPLQAGEHHTNGKACLLFIRQHRRSSIIKGMLNAQKYCEYYEK